MGNSLYDLSGTAGSNTSIDGNGIAGSSARSLGDNVIRSLAAFLKRFVSSIGGTAAVSGTDTYTVTITEDWSAYANGMLLTIKPANANTGPATLNVTPASAVALGAKKIRRQGDTALSANDMLANGVYMLRYDSAYDTAAGAFVLLNPQAAPVTVTSGQSLVTFRPGQNEPPSSNYATFGVRNGHSYLAFDTTTSWSAIFTGVMPSRYAGGGITVIIRWTGNGTGTNKVCFAVEMERVDVGTTDFDSDSFASAVTDTTGVAANATSGIAAQTSIALTAGAQMDSVVAGDTFRLRLSRAVSEGNDTFANDAQVLSVEIRET